MTSPLTSETRFYVCDSLFLDTKKVKSHFFKMYNNFYNNNNYIYPDEYTQKSYWNTNKHELPEWYNTERDQEIVDEVFNEYELFYDPYLSVEMEQKIEDEYQKQNEITESDSSDSEGEWCNVD